MGGGAHMAGGALRGRTVGSRAEGVVIEGDGGIGCVLRLQQLPHEVLRPLHVAAGRLPGRRSALPPACSTSQQLEAAQAYRQRWTRRMLGGERPKSVIRTAGREACMLAKDVQRLHIRSTLRRQLTDHAGL